MIYATTKNAIQHLIYAIATMALCQCGSVHEQSDGYKDSLVFNFNRERSHGEPGDFIGSFPCPPPWNLSLICTSTCSTLSCTDRTDILTTCARDLDLGCDVLTSCEKKLNCTKFINSYKDQLDNCQPTSTTQASTASYTTKSTAFLPTHGTAHFTTVHQKRTRTTSSLLITGSTTDSDQSQSTTNASPQNTVWTSVTQENGDSTKPNVLFIKPHSENAGVNAAAIVVPLLLLGGIFLVGITLFILWRKHKSKSFTVMHRQKSTDSAAPLQRTEDGCYVFCLFAKFSDGTKKDKEYEEVPIDDLPAIMENISQKKYESTYS